MGDRAGRKAQPYLARSAIDAVFQRIEPGAVGQSHPVLGAELAVVRVLYIGGRARGLDEPGPVIGPIQPGAPPPARVARLQSRDIAVDAGQHVGFDAVVEILAGGAQAMSGRDVPNQLAEQRIGAAILRIGRGPGDAGPFDIALVLQFGKVAPRIGQHRRHRARAPCDDPRLGELVVRRTILRAQRAAERLVAQNVGGIAGGETHRPRQTVAAVQGGGRPPQKLDRLDQTQIDIVAAPDILRAEAEAIGNADAVDLDQDAVAADAANDKALIPRAARRTLRRTEAGGRTPDADPRFEADQILDVGRQFIRHLIGVLDRDSHRSILHLDRYAGCSDDDITLLRRVFLAHRLSQRCHRGQRQKHELPL